MCWKPAAVATLKSYPSGGADWDEVHAIAVTARGAQARKMPPLANQPLAPAIEFAPAIGLQRLSVAAAGDRFPARQPWPLSDPDR